MKKTGMYKKAGDSGNRSVGMYIAVLAIVVMICAPLGVYLAVHEDEPIPVKQAYFPPQPKTPGFLEKGGAVEMVADRVIGTVVDKVVDKVVEKAMKTSEVQTGIGVAKLAAGERSDAIKNFDAVIEANPNDPAGYLKRSAAFMVNGEIELGTQDIEKAADLNPMYRPLAVKSRGIAVLLAKANIKVSPDQIKAMMERMTPEDVQRVTTQMMSPAPEPLERNVLGNQ